MAPQPASEYYCHVQVKKFRCSQCGGPKVNPYATPYIVCDFCGSFTDIDFAVGIDTWNQNTAATLGYQMKKAELMALSQRALSSCDRDGYHRLQRQFWDLYYQTFPAYLPPTISDVDKYNAYLDVCAASSVDSAFDPKYAEMAARQQHLQNAVRYVQNASGTKAEASSFFELAEYFAEATREGMRAFYDNPNYAIMHELLPEALHLKMRSSMFVQAWLPYLEPPDANRLLSMFGFSNEYEELERPAGDTAECPHCKSAVYVPEGSYRVFCESCRRTIAARSRFFCMSCGAENEVPEDPSLPAACSRCGIANRLVRPQFGD